MIDSAIPLPDGWGEARLMPGEHASVRSATVRTERAALHSYDHRGARLAWTPGQACAGARRLACDVEHVARFQAAANPARADHPWSIESWVVTEVLAKLNRIPMLAWLRRFGTVTIEAGSPVRLELEPFGLRGIAHVVLASGEGRQHVAAFGARERGRGDSLGIVAPRR